MIQQEKDRLLALFENESRWCQCVEARDEQGNPVRYNDPTATAWDVAGGMCFLFGWERACKLFLQVGRDVAGPKRQYGRRNLEIAAMTSLQDFNDKDDTTYDLVMERLRNLRVYYRKPASLA